jgi:hypothetical protein
MPTLASSQSGKGYASIEEGSAVVATSSGPLDDMKESLRFCCFDHATNEVVDKRTLHQIPQEADSAGGSSNTEKGRGQCDACPFCADVCDQSAENPLLGGCQLCARKLQSADPAPSGKQRPTYTPCQVARHNTIGSCWLIRGREILDASSVILEHPGGIRSILRRAGTSNNSEKDFQFHSPETRRRWKDLTIGELVACPGHPSVVPADKPDNCTVS